MRKLLTAIAIATILLSFAILIALFSTADAGRIALKDTIVFPDSLDNWAAHGDSNIAKYDRFWPGDFNWLRRGIEAIEAEIGTVSAAGADSNTIKYRVGALEGEFIAPDSVVYASNAGYSDTARYAYNFNVFDSLVAAEHVQIDSTLTVGVNGTGYDVNCYGDSTGGRMFWDTSKMAFRAGRVEDEQWHLDSTGMYSFAGGWQCMASGFKSFAYGCESEAKGPVSTAMGWSVVDGNYSVGLGLTIIEDQYSAALGHHIVLAEQGSYGFGRFVGTDTLNSMVIGSGINSGFRLINNIPSSIMLGVGSTTPTMTIVNDTLTVDSVVVVSDDLTVGDNLTVGNNLSVSDTATFDGVSLFADTVEGTKDTSAVNPIAYHLYTGGLDTLDEAYLHLKGPTFLDNVIMGSQVWHCPGSPPVAIGGSGFTIGDDADILWDTTGIHLGAADSLKFGDGVAFTRTGSQIVTSHKIVGPGFVLGDGDSTLKIDIDADDAYGIFVQLDGNTPVGIRTAVGGDSSFIIGQQINTEVNVGYVEGATTFMKGIYVATQGATEESPYETVMNNYAGYFSAQAGSTTYGIYAEGYSAGSDTNWAAYFASGNVKSENDIYCDTLFGIADSALYAKTGGDVDSATASGYADSALVSSYADSTPVTAYADSSPVAAYADSTLVTAYADSAAVSAYADSTPVTAYADSTPVTAYADSALAAADADTAAYASYSGWAYDGAAADLADSAVVTAYADSALVSSYADSTPVTALADSSVVTAYADSALVSSFADSTPVTALADSAVVSAYADSSPVCEWADSSSYVANSDSANYATAAGDADSARNGDFYVGDSLTIGDYTVLSDSNMVIDSIWANYVSAGVTSDTVAYAETTGYAKNWDASAITWDDGLVVTGTDEVDIQLYTPWSGLEIADNRLRADVDDTTIARKASGLYVKQDIYDLIGDANTTFDESNSGGDAGAALIGAYDEFFYSSGTNVQDVLDDLDAQIAAYSDSVHDFQVTGVLTADSMGGDITMTGDLAVEGTVTTDSLVGGVTITGELTADSLAGSVTILHDLTINGMVTVDSLVGDLTVTDDLVVGSTLTADSLLGSVNIAHDLVVNGVLTADSLLGSVDVAHDLVVHGILTADSLLGDLNITDDLVVSSTLTADSLVGSVTILHDLTVNGFITADTLIGTADSAKSTANLITVLADTAGANLIGVNPARHVGADTKLDDLLNTLDTGILNKVDEEVWSDSLTAHRADLAAVEGAKVDTNKAYVYRDHLSWSTQNMSASSDVGSAAYPMFVPPDTIKVIRTMASYKTANKRWEFIVKNTASDTISWSDTLLTNWAIRNFIDTVDVIVTPADGIWIDVNEIDDGDYFQNIYIRVEFFYLNP